MTLEEELDVRYSIGKEGGRRRKRHRKKNQADSGLDDLITNIPPVYLFK